MAKILKIDSDIVFIGMDDKSVKKVNASDCNFQPEIGMEVDVFETDDTVFVTEVIKGEVNTNSSTQGGYPGQGINISINNAQSNDQEQANDQKQVNTQTQRNYQSQQNAVLTQGRAVNKVVYLVLCFFLGGIGAHKFYAGKTGKGIMYLLFCWTSIPSILAFFTFVFGIFRKSDEYGNITV